MRPENESCATCRYFEEGYCKLPRIENRPMKANPTNWCQNYARRETLEPEDKQQDTGVPYSGEFRTSRNTGPEPTVERRKLVLDRVKIVVCWDDGSEEVAAVVDGQGISLSIARTP